MGSLRRSGAKRRAEECSPSKSQPMCECQRPLSTPRQPGAPWVCGLCGSPSSSVKVWCLRWSATQWITAPWTDIEPRIASVARSHGLAWKERWVNRRWKPIVTPKPTAAYMTARIARSRPVTEAPHRSQRAARKPRKGSTTATTVIWRSSRAAREVVMWTWCPDDGAVHQRLATIERDLIYHEATVLRHPRHGDRSGRPCG